MTTMILNSDSNVSSRPYSVLITSLSMDIFTNALLPVLTVEELLCLRQVDKSLFFHVTKRLLECNQYMYKDQSDTAASLDERIAAYRGQGIDLMASLRRLQVNSVVFQHVQENHVFQSLHELRLMPCLQHRGAFLASDANVPVLNALTFLDHSSCAHDLVESERISLPQPMTPRLPSSLQHLTVDAESDDTFSFSTVYKNLVLETMDVSFKVLAQCHLPAASRTLKLWGDHSFRGHPFDISRMRHLSELFLYNVQITEVILPQSLRLLSISKSSVSRLTLLPKLEIFNASQSKIYELTNSTLPSSLKYADFGTICLTNCTSRPLRKALIASSLTSLNHLAFKLVTDARDNEDVTQEELHAFQTSLLAAISKLPHLEHLEMTLLESEDQLQLPTKLRSLTLHHCAFHKGIAWEKLNFLELKLKLTENDDRMAAALLQQPLPASIKALELESVVGPQTSFLGTILSSSAALALTKVSLTRCKIDMALLPRRIDSVIVRNDPVQIHLLSDTGLMMQLNQCGYDPASYRGAMSDAVTELLKPFYKPDDFFSSDLHFDAVFGARRVRKGL